MAGPRFMTDLGSCAPNSITLNCDASETWYRLAKEAAAVLLSGAPVMQPHLLQTLRPALLRAAAVLYKGLVESANECGRDEYAISQSLTGLNHVICYGPGVTLVWQAALGAASDSLKTCCRCSPFWLVPQT